MKLIIFGPIAIGFRRAIKAIDAFLNPSAPPPTPFSEVPQRSFHEKLFLS